MDKSDEERWIGWGEERESHMEQMRKYLSAKIAEQSFKYKPSIIERIICKLNFNQLMKGLK